MATTSWYTSSDLVEAVQRKISMPLDQSTFTADSLLKFANEEMELNLVPSVLLYHEEYFVKGIEVPLIEDQDRYSIPSRAIGMRLRDVMYKDSSGNLFEMTRVDAGDKAYYQRNVSTTTSIAKFYLENDEVVLVPKAVGGVVGSLVFYVFFKPNQLVDITRAATLQSITSPVTAISKNFLTNSSFIQIAPTNTITINSHGFLNGNKIEFETTDALPSGITEGALYYAVNVTTNTFQISTSVGGSPVNILSLGSGTGTATRMKTLTNGFAPNAVDFTTGTITTPNHDYAAGDRVLFSSTNVLPTPLVENTFYYIINPTQNTFQVSTTFAGPVLPLTLIGTGFHTVTSDITILNFDTVPTNIINSSLIDFLQTALGHKTFDYDIQIPSNGISASSISFLTSQIPNGFSVGDYICAANECIIPQIPSDLHNGLAERTCARVLAALGDQAGLSASQAKIQEIENRQGTLLDQRVEGSSKKITNRHSLLRYSRMGVRRRL